MDNLLRDFVSIEGQQCSSSERCQPSEKKQRCMNRVVKDGCQPKFEPNIPFPVSGVWSTPPCVKKEYNRTTEREMRRACKWEGMASWPLAERLQPLRGSGCRAEVWVKCLPARDWGVFALYEMSISPASVSWREEGDRGAWPGCQIPTWL